MIYMTRQCCIYNILVNKFTDRLKGEKISVEMDMDTLNQTTQALVRKMHPNHILNSEPISRYRVVV